ncbi:DUF4291 family protein [Streptomyces chiangmaiensis]|uniref:DUF4291 family protein n=1 Tax=Streptomyces chiangmaiensis TaxID=766497 RepID=A0ABU7FX50_9ACTN|nr:DUF4291 family protein [Streptomyces chiangmaiensis]MED7828523.1 DUF4291 family protein [Streptomyces chiangmaiensis]
MPSSALRGGRRRLSRETELFSKRAGQCARGRRARRDCSTRLTWVKPLFLWMMYRCGWARRQGGRPFLLSSCCRDRARRLRGGDAQRVPVEWRGHTPSQMNCWPACRSLAERPAAAHVSA